MARAYNPEGLGFCILDFGEFPTRPIPELRYVLDVSGSMGSHSNIITMILGQLLCDKAYKGSVHEFLFSDTDKEFRKTAKELVRAENEYSSGGTLFKTTLDKLRRSDRDHSPIVIVTDGAVSDATKIEFSESAANFPVVMVRFGEDGATSFFEKVSRCLTHKAPDVVNMTAFNLKEKLSDVVDKIMYEKPDLKVELAGCVGKAYFGDAHVSAVLQTERFCIVDRVPTGCVLTHNGVKRNVDFEVFPHVDPEGMMPWIADVQKQIVCAITTKMPVDVPACVADLQRVLKFLKVAPQERLNLAQFVSRACTTSLGDKIKSCINCVQQIENYVQRASVLDSNEMACILAISGKDFGGFDPTAKKDKGFLRRYADELGQPKKPDRYVLELAAYESEEPEVNSCIISCLTEFELSVGAARECQKLQKEMALQELFTAIGVVGFSATCSMPQKIYPAPEMFADEVDRYGADITFYGYTLGTSVFCLMQREGNEFTPPGEDKCITMVVPVLQSGSELVKKSFLKKFGNGMCAKYVTGVMADIPDMGVFVYFQFVRSLFEIDAVFEKTLFDNMLRTFKWFAFENSSLVKGHSGVIDLASAEHSASVKLVSAAAHGVLTCAHLAGVQNTAVFYAGILALDAPPCESLARHLYILEAYFAHKYAKKKLSVEDLVASYETCVERHDDWNFDIVEYPRFSTNMALLKQPIVLSTEFVFAATLFAVLCDGEQKQLATLPFDAAKPDLFNLQQISAFVLEKERVAKNKEAKRAAQQHFAEHVLRAAHTKDREEIKALLLAALTQYTTHRAEGVVDLVLLTPTPSLLLQPFVLPEEFVMPADLRDDWAQALTVDSADPLLAFASMVVEEGVKCSFFNVGVQLDGPKSLTEARYEKFQLFFNMGTHLAQKLQALVHKLKRCERENPNRHGWGKSNEKPAVLPCDFVMCDDFKVSFRRGKAVTANDVLSLHVNIDQARVNVDNARKKVGDKMLPLLDKVIRHMALDEGYFLGPIFKALVEACEKLCAIEAKLPPQFRKEFEFDVTRLKFRVKGFTKMAEVWGKKF